MAWINSNELRWLKQKNEILYDENVQLMEQKSALDLKLFHTYGGEMIEKISKELNLTDVQTAKLRFIFSIEHCRICGVPEDRIVHNREELERVFMVGEA